MATNRIESDILPKESSDEISKMNILEKRSSIKDENSSSSSNGTNGENMESNGKDSPMENTITSSSTTTDSDSKSEEGDIPPVEKKKKKKKNAQDRAARRIKHFRKLFQSEIQEDLPTLIDTYVCAYQGDILLQGKMYITDRYLCFYSRIINYVTKHVYRWEEIDSVTKERVAFIFPTAIGLKLGEPKRKIVYASFLARDDAYAKIKSIWAQHKSNPNSGGDDDVSGGYDGTLKPSDKYSTIKLEKRNSYDYNNGAQADDITPTPDNLRESTRKHRRENSVSPNPKDKTHQPKIINSTQRDPIERNSSVNRKLKNYPNENNTDTKKNRFSRKSKDQQTKDETTKRGRSSTKSQPRNPSSQRHSSQVLTNRQASTAQQALYNSAALSNTSTVTDTNINANIGASTISTNDTGISTRALNMFVSFINLIIQNVSSIFNYFQMYSTKTTTFILLLLTILFFHSFYLIALAYRVENRLQSLHNLWPSSLLKNSLSSNSKQML